MADDHSFFFRFFGEQGKCTSCGDDCDPDHILCFKCRRPLPAASHDETGQDTPAAAGGYAADVFDAYYEHGGGE